MNKHSHYNQGTIECIDAIRSALTPEEFRGFCKGNIIKYVWRERKKGGLADLLKASDYLDWAIENDRTEEKKIIEFLMQEDTDGFD